MTEFVRPLHEMLHAPLTRTIHVEAVVADGATRDVDWTMTRSTAWGKANEVPRNSGTGIYP